MIDVVKLVFKICGIKPSKKAVLELLGPSFLVQLTPDNIGSSNLSYNSAVKNKRFLKIVEQNTKVKNSEIDHLLLHEFHQLMIEKVTHISESIQNNIPPYETILHDEWLLFCCRMTVLRDGWYQGKEKTKDRGPFVPFIYHLFVLSMHLRLWRRSKLIFQTPGPDDELPSVWCTYKEFVGKTGKDEPWFYVLADENKDDPIIKWSPTKIFRAMYSLMRSRISGTVNLQKKGAQRTFVDYRDALFDRLAMVVCCIVAGSPEEISKDHPNWFVLKGTITNDAIADDSLHKALSRQVRESIDKETKRVIKENCLEVEFDQSRALETRQQLHDRLSSKREQSEYERLKSRLETLKCRKSLLEQDSNGDDQDSSIRTAAKKFIPPDDPDEAKYAEEDLQEIINLGKEIEGLIVLLKSIEAANLIAQSKEEEANAKLSAAVFSNKTTDATSKQFSSLSCATPDFTRDNMLLADHLCIWQFPDQLYHIPRYEEVFKKKVSLVYHYMLNTVTRGNDEVVLEDSQKWIIERSVCFCERESYRSVYSSEAIFNVLDVCTTQRGGDQTILKGFGTDLTVLVSDTRGEYYNDMINAATHRWFKQSIPKVDIDATIFLWDVEEEYVSLNRLQLLNPVICRIGSDWCVLRNGNWDNEEFNINCIWVGENILECVVIWLEIMNTLLWTVLDRNTNQVIRLEKTIFKQMYDEMASFN